MHQDYRYSLTRICLRNGELTLPLRMVELFPDSGSVQAVDTVLGQEFELSIRGRRRIGGFGEFFRQHHLNVNDAILIRKQEDGRYSLTPMTRQRKPDYNDPATVARLLDAIALAGPVTEAEIRALHEEIPPEFDLTGVLRADGRFEHRGGRWGLRKEEPAPPPAAANPASAFDDLSFLESGPPMPDPASATRRAEAPPVPPAEVLPLPKAEVLPPPTDGALPPPEEDLPPLPASDTPPLPSGAHPRGASGHTDRAGLALTRLGFQVEDRGGGMLLARADLGRRGFSVAVSVLPDRERPDWAALLAQRRDLGADYLAIVGDHRDLHRLDTGPAGLARATLWSWDGLNRILDLAGTLLLGPPDLEPFFQRDGVSGAGLDRFERWVARRIEERGAFSAVLTRLATMPAPTVFRLDEILDAGVPREQASQVLAQLAQAPFHLISRAENGDYCLRHGVADALKQLAQYAESLRGRLPKPRRVESGHEVL